GAIWIDQTAAGYGWFIDPTPAADSASPAVPGSPAYGKIDLLTVVEHELGHELGFDDTAGDGLMSIFLGTGVRRTPAVGQPGVGLGGTAPVRLGDGVPKTAVILGAGQKQGAAAVARLLLSKGVSLGALPSGVQGEALGGTSPGCPARPQRPGRERSPAP